MGLAEALRAREEDVVELTEALVRQPSPNPPGDERRVAAVIDEYLAGVSGIRRQLIAPRPERPNLVFSTGKGDRALALAAHLDTHPIVGEWRFDPLGERDADRIYGRGTTDNKGAVAAMAVVFRAAAEHGLPDQARLVLIANADEEVGGSEGIGALVDGIDEPIDAVVVGEPSGIDEPWEALYVAARGTSRFTIGAMGVRTHSSLAGRPGVRSALETIEGAVAALRSRLSPLNREHPVFGPAGRLTVVRAVGGEGYGVVPELAQVEVELRLMPGATQTAIEQEITDALDGFDVALAFADGSLRWMGPSEIDLDHPLTGAASAAWRDVFEAEPVLACFPGGTDARLFTERGFPALSGVGPGALVRAHQPDEYVTIDELQTASHLYAAIVDRWTRTRETE